MTILKLTGPDEHRQDECNRPGNDKRSCSKIPKANPVVKGPM